MKIENRIRKIATVPIIGTKSFFGINSDHPQDALRVLSVIALACF